MRILNAMFGRGLGGIEQAFLDYNVSLQKLGHDVLAFVRPNAEITQQLPPSTRTIQTKDLYYWGFYGQFKLRKLIKELKPDIIITHGNRATGLLRPAAKRLCPVVSVAHNYSYNRLIGSDAIIAITADLYREILSHGQRKDKLFHIPNMIFVPTDLGEKKYHHPPVIGAMGRFVKKKGFSILLWALAELKKKDMPFQAVIAGDGEEMQHLKKLCRTLQLEEQVHFPGWIHDKRKFFEDIDIFCVPSLHEPFGIVLLEAFYHQVPVIASDTEGPSLIIDSMRNGIIVPKENVFSLFSELRNLLINTKLARDLADRARKDVEQKYDSRIVSRQIQAVLDKTIAEFK